MNKNQLVNIIAEKELLVKMIENVYLQKFFMNITITIMNLKIYITNS